MSNFGPVHKLTVRQVGQPYGPLDTSEFEDYEIDHPPECEFSDDPVYGRRYKCAVGENECEGGVRWSLHYVGTPITAPGEYSVIAWAEVYKGYDYTEYDGGLALYEPEAQDDLP